MRIMDGTSRKIESKKVKDDRNNKFFGQGMDDKDDSSARIKQRSLR